MEGSDLGALPVGGDGTALSSARTWLIPATRASLLYEAAGGSGVRRGQDVPSVVFGGLVKPGQCVEVDHILQGILIKQYVLQRGDCRSPVLESPECLLTPPL